jgi:ADP-ribose pyrophosphatase YjhB (NUDIX family)
MPRRKRPEKKRTNKIRAISAKEVSVLAWIQDAFSNVLLVRQSAGRQLWSLPGGKVRANEALARALRREIKEEIGLTVQSAENLDIFDRPEKSALAVLFRVTLRKGRLQIQDQEIMEAAFFSSLPLRATPSARYFWKRRCPITPARRKRPA